MQGADSEHIEARPVGYVMRSLLTCKWVPPEERSELLAAKDAAGVSGLANALMNGRLDAVDEYIEIVEKTAPSLNAQECAALLKDLRER